MLLASSEAEIRAPLSVPHGTGRWTTQNSLAQNVSSARVKNPQSLSSDRGKDKHHMIRF